VRSTLRASKFLIVVHRRADTQIADALQAPFNLSTRNRAEGGLQTALLTWSAISFRMGRSRLRVSRVGPFAVRSRWVSRTRRKGLVDHYSR